MWRAKSEDDGRTLSRPKHLCKASLGHLEAAEAKTNAHTGRRPRRCWRAKISEDDGAAHAFDAKHRHTDLL